MRKFLGLCLFALALLILPFGNVCFGQTASISATITDNPDGTAWASLNGYNATYSVILVNALGGPVAPGQAYRKDTGATVTNPAAGFLDGTGSLSVTVVSNNNITPNGTLWQFKVCPATSSGVCNTVTLPVNASGSLSTQLSAGAGSPRISGGVGSYAYNDGEVTAVANNSYLNITTPALRCYGTSWAACGGGGGGSGTVPSGTKGQTTYYGANGNVLTAITAAAVVPPSGDTSGATDVTNITAACVNSPFSVQLTAGAYSVNGPINVTVPCRIVGVGNSTIITNKGTTNDIFRISYFTTWQEGPWVYPASTNQSEFAWFQVAQAGTPTAGYVFDIGSGVAPGGGDFFYTMNVDIHDTVINGTWGGAKFVDSQLYSSLHDNMWRQFVGGGCIFYNAQVGSGDNEFGPMQQCSGLTNSGVIIAQSDVQTFGPQLKLNGSGVSFTGAGVTKTVMFDSVSIETGILNTGCAFDFGTGTAPTNIQIVNSESFGFGTLFCHPSNVTNFGFQLANSSATSDYAAGLLTNNGWTTVTFPPSVTYQDFASFAGSSGTLLSAYTTTSPGSGKTFTLYSNAAGTTIPQLNGSGSAVLPSGSDSTFGDSLDTLTPSSANYTVGISCTKIGGSPTMGIFARALSASNTNYAFQYTSTSNQVQLYSQHTGTFVQLNGTQTITWTAGTAHTLTLTVNGTAISAAVDGTPITGSPFTDVGVTAAGQGGFRITGAGDATCTSFYIQ